MKRTLPPLSPLRAFEATVRLGSMTRAAEELGRTHGAVSRQIRSLEDTLGCSLFERDAVPIRPTGAGTELYAGVAAAFDTLERTMARMPGRRSSAVVRLACGSTFATRWIVPRLPRFYEANPGISIQLTIIANSIYETADFDFATTWDRLSYPTPIGDNVVVLGDSVFALVCRPDYPRRVDGRRIELGTILVAETATAALPAFAQRAGVEIAADRTMPFPHMHLCIEGALGGLGATLVETRLVADELADGRLVAPLPPLAVPDGFVGLFNPRRQPTPALRRLVRWLADEAKPGPRP